MSEFCRLRRNEGYGACDDEAGSAFLLPAGPERKTLVRACPKNPKEKTMKVRTTQ